MSSRVRSPLAAARASVLLALIALLAGCGSSARSGATATVPPGTCQQTVLRTLGAVLERIYHEGVKSERTGAAQHIVETSVPLRQALESGNTAATAAAARALVATGRITNLRIVAGGGTVADIGSAAVTPLRGTINNAAGSPIASYTTSVWSDAGLTAEGQGVTQGLVVISRNGRSLGGTPQLPAGTPGGEGTLKLNGVDYQFFSFGGEAYPAGGVRIYLLRQIPSLATLCGATPEETLVNTLSHIASLIYAGEVGARTQIQVRRVAHDPALLAAVARQDPAAARLAIDALLNQHVVRLRVEVGGKLLADVGGPYVLGPVGGTLRSGGRRIGTFLLSIQDDEGYKRLAGRLAGLKVLMYEAPAQPGGPPLLVKNSLGPSPGTVGASGRFTYQGQTYRVATVNATAFPTGPLTIRVLIPIPYS